MTSELVRTVVEEGQISTDTSWMRKFVLEPEEVLTGVVAFHQTTLQQAMPCDNCGRDLPADSEVLGKVVEIARGSIVRSRFSPTCIECAPTLHVPEGVRLL